MHRPFLRFRYPYEAHALTHHRIFKADETYHLKKDSDKKTIPMKWWNGPVIIVIGALPAVFLSWLLGMWSIWIIFVIVAAAYYGTYERIHWCMHLPKARRIEKSWPFYRLNGHHLLHHRYVNKNFNVVLPFADLVFGTLLLRSKIRFNQAVGPSVPDVQPKH